MTGINQTNVHLVIPSKVSWMAGMLMNDGKMNLEEAIKHIYKSDTYKKLEIEATKYWHWGPVDLYRELTDNGA